MAAKKENTGGNTIDQGGQRFETLNDILPENSDRLDILFIAKTPATKSVSVGTLCTIFDRQNN